VVRREEGGVRTGKVDEWGGAKLLQHFVEFHPPKEGFYASRIQLGGKKSLERKKRAQYQGGRQGLAAGPESG